MRPSMGDLISLSLYKIPDLWNPARSGAYL
jgi:hypothetical protein